MAHPYPLLALITLLAAVVNGALGYGCSTISGPPLAVMLSNQGFVLHEFRAALGLIRLAESSLTAASYTTAGLIGSGSLTLALSIVPSVIVGVPIGAWIIRHVRAETFRRV